jgi:hypothetical protein
MFFRNAGTYKNSIAEKQIVYMPNGIFCEKRGKTYMPKGIFYLFKIKCASAKGNFC